jgi:hypothetical protein
VLGPEGCDIAQPGLVVGIFESSIGPFEHTFSKKATFSPQALDSQKALSRMAVAGSLKTAWKTSGAKKSAIPLRGREPVADIPMVLIS